MVEDSEMNGNDDLDNSDYAENVAEIIGDIGAEIIGNKYTKRICYDNLTHNDNARLRVDAQQELYTSYM